MRAINREKSQPIEMRPEIIELELAQRRKTNLMKSRKYIFKKETSETGKYWKYIKQARMGI